MADATLPAVIAQRFVTVTSSIPPAGLHCAGALIVGVENDAKYMSSFMARRMIVLPSR
ncbi:hypothetical protein ACU4GR_06545 [Methylobacterium oryzae CBMB20]